MWKVFLFYGLIVLVVSAIISASISTYFSNKIAEKMAGPVCRVELPTDRFEAPPKKAFPINFRITNYRGENLFLEEVSSYCFWQIPQIKEQEKKLSDKIVPDIKLPTTEDLIQPAERPFIPAYGSKPWQSSCYSPDAFGEYNVRIYVKTHKGDCESNIIMVVKRVV